VTTLHRAHDLAVTTDEDAYLDRLHEAREMATAPDGPCTCSHDVDDHWPREGCLRRDCLCWWWS
jgi:hypothetical protein